MHPVANVGLSSTASTALTTLLVWLLSLCGVTVPGNVVDAITVLVAVGAGYLINVNSKSIASEPAAPAPAPIPTNPAAPAA